MIALLSVTIFLLGIVTGRHLASRTEESRAKRLAKNIIELTEEMTIDDDPPPFVRRIK